MITDLINKKRRIEYADLVKCIAIYLVLWGHAITQLMNNSLLNNRTYIFIYAFHMPLFMLVSGFFAHSSMKLKFHEICIKKFKQLIIPALSFGVLWYIHDIIMGGRPLTIKAFIHLEAECFWFLKCLFFAYLFAWVTYRFKKWKPFIAIVFCLLFMALQYFGQTFFKMGIMLPCFYVGMALKNYLPQIERHKSSIGWSCALLFFILFPYFSEADLFANKFFQHISFSSFVHWGFCLIMGLLGSIITLCVSMYLDKHFKQSYLIRIFSKIGTYTLGIYLIQKILLELLLPHFLKVNMNIHLFNFLFTPIVSIIFLFICYYCTLALKQTKYTRILFLGEKE